LSNRRYLLFVVGPSGDKEGWFFTSKGTNVATTTWRFRQHWTSKATLNSAGHLAPGKWRTFQSANFVTEAPTGELYLVGMKETSGARKRNGLFIYRVTMHRGRLTFLFEGKKAVRTRIGGATFRAGGSIHVGPRGEVVAYAIEKAQGFARTLTLEEFRKR
jgi:hypothetical protein